MPGGERTRGRQQVVSGPPKRSKSRGRSKSVGPKARQRTRGTSMPPRPWRSGPVETSVKQLLGASDARVSSASTGDLALANQLNTITIGKVLQLDNLVWVANGYISRALERGFAAGASGTAVPYFAQIFMVNLLAAYAQDQQVPVVQIPYWLLCLGHAISPKAVTFAEGKVSYKFSIPQTLPYVGVSPTQFIGYAPYGFFYTLNPSGGVPVNGFPTVAPGGGGYTEQQGASAFQELVQFMANAAKTNPMSRLVPSSQDTPYKTDPSAFGTFALAEGLGSTGTGAGIYGQCQLEVPIRNLVLSLVSSGEDTVFTNLPTRNFNQALPVSGDPTYLGAMMSTVLDKKGIKSRKNARLKPVDFFEFGDTLAIFVQQIVQGAIDDASQFNGSGVISGDTVQKLLCPNTLQETLIMLRNTIMGAFKETQSAVQGIYPFRPSSGADDEFVPFVSSANTCLINALDMQLPEALVENMRALSARTVAVKRPVFATKKSKATQRYWYIPILGARFMDNLNSSDYTVVYKDSVSGENVTVPVFANGAIWEKSDRDVKGNVVKTMLVEAPISMVDGSTGTTMAFINDPESLKILISLWNNWIMSSGVSAISSKLITLGTEKGINVLCSISMTRLWNTAGGFRKTDNHRTRSSSIEDKKSVVSDVRMRAAKRRPLVVGPYATRRVIIDVSQGIILSAAWEQILQTWILPLVDDEEVEAQQSTIIQRWQFMQLEPLAIARSSGETGITLSSLHFTYASKMTKSKLAAQNDWGQFFAEMAARGRGGILSGLVAGLVGAAFPGISGVANTIAGALPI